MYLVREQRTLSVEQRKKSRRQSVNKYVLTHVTVGVGNGIVHLSDMLVKRMHGAV